MRSLSSLAVFAVMSLSLVLGACGPKTARVDAMDVEVTLDDNVAKMGRLIKVDLVGVGAAEGDKFSGKSVSTWFRGGDADRATARSNGTAHMMEFSAGGPVTQRVSVNDAFWQKAMAQQSESLFVFALIAGQDATGQDSSWRKKVALDSRNYEGGMVKLQITSGGIVVKNLIPEKK